MAGRAVKKGVKRRPRAPTFRGWISTDADEIKRREWRGRTEIERVSALDSECAPFCDYRVTSSTGNDYRVELRSRAERINSCECRDFSGNGLGTCKHIEGVLRRVRARRDAASPRMEVYLDERSAPVPRMTAPDAITTANPALVESVKTHYRKLRRGSSRAHAGLRELAQVNPGALRVSFRLEGWLSGRRAESRKTRARRAFEEQLERGERSVDDLLKQPLLPYQLEGVLHLAFGERALLADDMGLGKTVQAIAACALLRELRGIERVLVVSPASLKSEWDEQIGKFSNLSAAPVFGNPSARRRLYERGVFFTLCNYEQILSDADDLNAVLRPNVVILDEAQRIKNLRTKTAAAIKTLASPYAFVLTGTPLENRIDELYSILQFVNPNLLGPLFRFNREFYALDDRGRPTGYRNLDELAERIAPVMLRRRKEDVEGELPGRTVKTFFVSMTDEQWEFYRDFEKLAARLASIAQRRALTKEEFELLQRYLACMRMVCDTPYILEQKPFACPKMDELERLLPDLLSDPERKVIVFSEWVRMLSLVREYAGQSGLEFAWHTGEVPQHRRRAEISRFREDPDCRLFLSSESGGVGLNLQVADTVVNLDLPWNPARLEQRVARAWRKHQKRPVTVINLVSEDTIEHRMLALLDQKRALADKVLDRRGDAAEIKMPNSRAAFLERLDRVLVDQRKKQEEEGEPQAVDLLRDELLTRHGSALRHIFAQESARESDPESAGEGQERALVVLAVPADQAAEEQRRLAETTGLQIEVIDQVTHQAMLRLAESGFVSFPGEGLRDVLPLAEPEDDGREQRTRRAGELLEQAGRKFRAATLLEGGGFPEEAAVPAADAVCFAVRALAALRGDSEPEDTDAAAAFMVQPDSSASSAMGANEPPHGFIGILAGEVGAEGVAPVGRLIDWVAGEMERQRP